MILKEFAAKNITFPSNYAMNESVISHLKAKKWESVADTIRSLNEELNSPPEKTIWEKVKELAKKKVF